MNPLTILHPMLALVGVTMLVLAMVGFRRVTSRLHPREFALGESVAVPPPVSLPNRNFMNLMEVPVLFYVVCLTYYVTQRVDAQAVAVAWLFVAARLGHSAVHLTYNNVLHRLAFFAMGNFLLIYLWLHLLLRL